MLLSSSHLRVEENSITPSHMVGGYNYIVLYDSMIKVY